MWRRRRARHGSDPQPAASDFEVFTHRTVATGESPALVVIRDQDGDWIVLDRGDAPEDAADFLRCPVGVLLLRDPTLREAFANLPVGYCLSRDHPGGLWAARRLAGPEDPEPRDEQL